MLAGDGQKWEMVANAAPHLGGLVTKRMFQGLVLCRKPFFTTSAIPLALAGLSSHHIAGPQSLRIIRISSTEGVPSQTHQSGRLATQELCALAMRILQK